MAFLLAYPILVAADSAGSTLNFGPYNAVFLAGGIGIDRPLSGDSPVLSADGAWSMSGWIRVDRPTDGTAIVAAIGAADAHRCRCLVLVRNRLGLQISQHETLKSDVDVGVGSWHSFATTYDGHIAHLYVDGVERVERSIATSAVTASLHLAPASLADAAGQNHFGGALALFLLEDHALTPVQVERLHAAKPESNFALIDFHNVGVGWPLQEHAWRGLQEPQPAWTLPHGEAPFSVPVASIAAQPQPPLRLIGADTWALGNWHLAPVAAVREPPRQLSDPEYQENQWYAAEVPGTVLTTLIANGLYPDPDFGLNNLAIPESLNRQDYWYRTLFVPPSGLSGRRFTLTFKGINYAAEVWLNGTELGSIRGAFIRGIFDVSSLIRPGLANALAVRISPPPHPGIPHEQSVAAGPGENGGSLAIDGPTFVASEGWDWIPAIRDRNAGIWQDVELQAHGSVRILDPQVQTRLPLPRTDVADLVIRVPLENSAPTPIRAVIEARVGDIAVRKETLLSPGPGEIVFEPAEFRALRMIHPRLWWPNGYGSPDLYTLELAARIGDATSDTKSVRFGVRQITYELSLFDHAGNLRRVEVDPTAGTARDEQLVNVQHEAIKRTASGWAQSLTPAGETSPAVRELPATTLTPYLVIRVNGVRIAARGGSWGTDDSRKRIARARLEPYFRLHREAHLNIIRNWVGQNTEATFFDLADEYGLLVLNDFWASTQDFQLEPQDPQLFLANAADVVRRFRNHPSIALWIGRNEGVPQPIINEGLAALLAREDGTRLYTGSSNRINLQDSGPYNWRPPAQYFTDLAQGFSVEVGTPSLASLESLRRWIPQADLWPPGDVYAYHDWHSGGNGDTASFMHALTHDLGAASSLADFERKAQLMNYVSYRAIF
ncbi:MAG TPA: LamG-like jellyroll fold domain-containing protein, partial [Steroidobacteraceae bacterium]|nr:LamG-like jellyroll fold domain-containing protein [Steroidobacteraceae bacterium]